MTCVFLWLLFNWITLLSNSIVCERWTWITRKTQNVELIESIQTQQDCAFNVCRGDIFVFNRWIKRQCIKQDQKNSKQETKKAQQSDDKFSSKDMHHFFIWKPWDTSCNHCPICDVFFCHIVIWWSVPSRGNLWNLTNQTQINYLWHWTMIKGVINSIMS